MTAAPRARRWRLWRGPGAPPSERLTLQELVEVVKSESPNGSHDDRAQLPLFERKP